MSAPTNPRRWDDGDHTVKVVRRPDGSAFLVAIPTPSAWVFRKPILEACDVD